jgi:hypothetical protein
MVSEFYWGDSMSIQNTCFSAMVKVAVVSFAVFVSVLGASSVSDAQQSPLIRGTERQYVKLSRAVQRLQESVDQLSRNGSDVKNNVTDVKVSLGALNDKVSVAGKTGTTSTPTEKVIGSNVSKVNYESFDFYEGRRGEVIVQHNGTGILAWFRVLESAKVAQEYKLSFSFAGRSADQKAADTFMLQTCIEQFQRAADYTKGGSFFIYPSKDDSVGLLCSSTLNT